MSVKQSIFIEATSLTGHLSGVGHVTLETIRALDDDKYVKDYEIKLFVPRDEENSIKRYSFKNVKTVYLPFPHKFLSLFARLPLGPPLDLFLGRGTYIFPNFRNWTLARSKSITYIHDACFAIFPEYIQPRNLRFLQTYMGLWKRRANEVVAVSNASKQEIHTYLKIAEPKITTVANAVDVNFFKPQSLKETTRVREKYDLKNKYILFIGNIEPRKNLETLIDAFSRCAVGTNTSLFLVGGDGWLNESIHKAIEEARAKGIDVKKNATFVPDEDLPALLSGALVVVQPSWHEGFGMPVIQALACATPVICADIPSLREVTEGYESMVHFFAPDDEKALTKLLERVVSSKPQHRTVSGLRTWDDVAEDVIELVRRVSQKEKKT